jgi:hypothetical protein
MKTTTLLCLAGALTLGTLNSQAQKLNPFSNAQKATSFGAMASIPVGKFASTDINDGGYAKTGWGLYFDSKTIMKNGISFISHSTYSWVSLNQADLAKTFTAELGRKTTIDGGRHMPFLTTLGIGYEVHPTPAITIGVSAQGGLMYNSFKPFDINVYDNNNNLLFSDNLKFDSQFSFAYVFGAQVGFNVVKNLIDIQLTADYSAARFDAMLRGHTIPPIKTSQQIQLLNVGAGIVVHTK